MGLYSYIVGAVTAASFTLYQREDEDLSFNVTRDELVEVASQVFIRAGLATHKGDASINIQAPRDILILRGDIMSARKKNKKLNVRPL